MSFPVFDSALRLLEQIMRLNRHIFAIPSILVLIFAAAGLGYAQEHRRGEFARGTIQRIDDIPQSRLRNQINQLPIEARQRAVAWLGNLHFTEHDLASMHVDSAGGIFYADEFKLEPLAPAAAKTEPATANASVAVSPFPPNLVFHSRPGAPNVIYLNFAGETVSNTEWNTSLGRTSIPAVAFSIDSDYTTFSDSEQLAIRRIWQRVVEDYASFNVDVTTERPSSFTTRTAHALITRNTDSNGQPNPASTAGGVAYVGVFGISSYANYRPAWIYHNNLVNEESYVAEAVSHEVGHNLGLSHDGRTDGQDYYGGHGSGDTSWGPIMGTGYNRNVSQWSKGEYYLANNTQDDLATIAGKLSYRTDDRGSSLSSATALVIGAGGVITSTTLENDPSNLTPANKGVIERNTDVDWFSFTTGSGLVSLRVNPWVVASGVTRGGNVDLVAELYSSSGSLLLANNGSSTTYALIETNLSEGVYYLAVKSAAVGTPLSSTPTGYTIYGSVGEYYISGTVIPSSTTVIPPGAELSVADINQAGLGAHQLRVTYSDNVAVDVSTINSADLRAVSPSGATMSLSFVSVDQTSDGTPRVATYTVSPPGSVWNEQDNGVYTVSILADQVSDTEGAFVPARELGQFTVAVPRLIYSQKMDTNPGWSLQGPWEWGMPRYIGLNAPLTGFTGLNVLGYNLAGNYENRLSPTYTTTPIINCAGSSTLTLRFRRWLRLRTGDTANIQASTDGVNWTDFWTTTRSVTDSAWQEVQYQLPSAVAGSSTLRLRWGLASNNSQSDIGWNIDDVEIFGNGALDTTPPVAVLDAQNIVAGSSPVYTFGVTYSDNVAIRAATIGSGDLFVLGPNGYSNVVELAGIDFTTDGTPRIASYTVNAPANAWSSAHNGDYQIYLRADEVTDTSNNSFEETLLGTFKVAIPATVLALVVDPTSFSVSEGSNASFTVRLSEQPSANVTVTIQRVTGDSDIVAGSTSVEFTSANWNVPVSVAVSALSDADTLNGSATIECRSQNISSVSVFVSEIDTTPTPPTVALTSPADGATFLASDSITFAANATDDVSVSKVEFFSGSNVIGTDTSQPYSISTSLPAGTHVITARATDGAGASTTSAAVTITVNAPNQPPTVTLTSPANGATFLTTDAITFDANATDDVGVTKVQFFSGSSMIGEDTSAPYSIAAPLTAGSHLITAKATDGAGASATSAAVTITVSAPNQPPTVTLTSPTNGATFLTTDTITFAANAADDVAVTKVTFHSGSSLIGEDTTAPYSITASLNAGTHSITAQAIDGSGASATSDAATITVNAPNQPPTVALTSPANGATFLTTDAISFAANASDDIGVTKVEFFSGANLIGADDSAPYSITASLAAGTHSIIAKATDGAGATALTLPITVTVTVPNQPPTVTLLSPVDGATFWTTDSISFEANASDDVFVTKVEFFSGSNLIGEDSSEPYTIAASLPAGTQTITAKATDNSGVSVTSAMITITINVPNQSPTVALTSPAGGATFLTTEAITFAADATDDAGVTKVQFFSGTNLIGEDTAAPYSISASLSAGTHFINAKAIDGAGASATSGTVTITVNAPNQLPTVTLTSPANGATFLTTDTISFAADASDDIGVTKVEFFSGSNMIGEDTTAPYTITTSLAAGTHVITAKATDGAGASVTSPTVTITVNAPNQSPTVTLTSPANGATFLATDTISFAANASDDVAVTKVEFFSGSDLIGADTTAPYAITASLAAGTHSITARATDGDGAVTTSSTVAIQIHVPNQPPTISLVCDQAGKTHAAPATIILSATAQDDGTVTQVEFLKDGVSVGVDTSAPFEFTLSNVGAGVYQLSAVATDNVGATTTAGSIEIHVAAEPKITSAVASGSTWTIIASATSGISHDLEITGDFATWTKLSAAIAENGSVTFWGVPIHAQQFFRVVAR